MASIQRIRCELTGTTGLPGLATFYSTTSVPSAKADVEDFWDAVRGLMPSGLSIRVPNTGDIIEDSTGELVGTWTEGSAATLNGSNALEYAAGVGVRIQWNTGGIRNGRRVRGATFLCPLTRDSFDAQGTIGSSSLSTIQAAADALAASGEFVIWSRPTSTAPASGDSFAVTGATVPDRITALRSRRY